jgi:hypothetical protein
MGERSTTPHGRQAAVTALQSVCEPHYTAAAKRKSMFHQRRLIKALIGHRARKNRPKED